MGTGVQTRARRLRVVSLREGLPGKGALRVDREKGIIFGVKICGTTSTNTHGIRGVEGTDYPIQVLRESNPLYGGINVNIGHRLRALCAPRSRTVLGARNVQAAG